jgi:hypothetical protein
MLEKEDDFKKCKEMSCRSEKGNVLMEKRYFCKYFRYTDTCSGCRGVETWWPAPSSSLC